MSLKTLRRIRVILNKIEIYLELTQRRIHLKALEIISKATDFHIYPLPRIENPEEIDANLSTLNLARSRTLSLSKILLDRAAKYLDICSRWRCVIHGERTLESARANERQRDEGRRRLAGKTDHPDVYPSLWCHVLIERAWERERKRARATTSARRDVSIDARNRRFRDAKQESWSFLNRRLPRRNPFQMTTINILSREFKPGKINTLSFSSTSAIFFALRWQWLGQWSRRICIVAYA